MTKATRKTSVRSPEESGPLKGQILDYLQAHNVMTIASCSANVPWAAAVFYASADFVLYFLSNPTSRHGTNIADNSQVSAAIHEDYHDWRKIRGIQLEGRAERLSSIKQQAEFWKVYQKKFPFVKDFFSAGSLRDMLSAKVTGIRLYRIVPSQVYYIDNSKGFGHREMLDLVPREEDRPTGKKNGL
ncbi:MAG: pyridoxamine 5'-phosphate oxidase family protein [Acidobacteria bacterium]|nr:pyridoxamine 5'-phosphate oxidase family protein [Acidobacteriota bacterium]